MARGAPKPTAMATIVTSITPSPPGVTGIALAMFAAAWATASGSKPG